MSINQALAEFKATDYTPKLCEAVLKVMPYSPDYVHFTTLDEAVAALRPRASAADIERVRAMDKDETLNDVLWMAKLLDTGDSGYMIYTGVRSAVNFFFGDKSRGLETDDQQRNDAVLKALGLAYMIYKAYPGSIAEKANLFRSTPTGQALALYYASVEVALPFADNALVKGGNILEDLFSKEGGEQMSRLTSMAGDHGIEGAQSMLTSIAEPLKRVVDHASNYVQPVAESAKKYVPAVMDGADKVAGVVASGADVLPVYRLLGARLAAEGAIIRALGTASNA
jgi:hypothetical protein